MPMREIYVPIPDCEYCAQRMERNKRGRPRIYCSDVCRQRDWRIRNGRAVEQRRLWRKGQRLVKAAKRKWGDDLHPGLLVRISREMRVPYCKECGKPYYVPEGGYEPAYKFCSE